MKIRQNILVFLLLTSYFLLLIYSFSQVDLNLTLSSNSLYQSFQSQMTNLGYFHRPLSTKLYLLIIFLLLTSYFLLLNAAKLKQISKNKIWWLIGLTVLILLPAYPAFSHDVFNNLFDARIVTKYGLSPWHFKALDFPEDTWIRFMRWTHRPTVYPPVWIGLSLIPSILGLGKFVLTLGLFKITAAAAYLGSCWLIFKIAKRLKHKNPLVTLSLFAFNPLVIIESLVNAHMEIVMIFLGLFSLHALFKKHQTVSWISYIASVGIKFMTLYLGLVLIKGKKYLRRSILLGMAGITVFIVWYGFQPWYILWILPFALLIKKTQWEKTLLILASLSALLWNIPLILYGDFDLPDPQLRLIYYVVLPLFVTAGIFALTQKINRKKLI